MPSFSDSYLGRLRAVVGSRRLLVPGARIVIKNPHGRLLMQYRADFDLWGLPGGNAEEGEGLEATVRRETLEETGLTVSDLKPFGFGCDPEFETIRFPSGDECQFFVMMFCTETFTGEPAATDDESRAVAWIDPADPPPMLPNMRRSIDAFREFERTGRFQMI